MNYNEKSTPYHMRFQVPFRRGPEYRKVSLNASKSPQVTSPQS